MTTCPNCGSIVMNGDSYCTHCGSTLRWSGNDEDDYEHGRRIANKRRRSRELQKEAWKQRQNGDPYYAEELINEAIELDRRNDENWNVKGIIMEDLYYDENQGQATIVEAYACYLNALRIKPYGETLKRNMAGFLIGWAEDFIQKQNYNKALEKINEALSYIDDKNSDNYKKAMELKEKIE